VKGCKKSQPNQMNYAVMPSPWQTAVSKTEAAASKGCTDANARSDRIGVLSTEVMLGKFDANPEKGDCGGLSRQMAYQCCKQSSRPWNGKRKYNRLKGPTGP
jgi:hypothetical protein